MSCNNKSGYILAENAKKEDGPFSCPDCNTQTVLKHGVLKIPHFAHKVLQENCIRRETAQHQWAKYLTWRTLYNAGFTATPEAMVGERRTDVLLQNGPFKIGIEFQNSFISLPEIIARTENYEHLNIPMIWIALRKDYTKLAVDNEIKLSAQERFMATLFRSLYVFGDSTILKLSLSHSQTYVEGFYPPEDSGYEMHEGYVYHHKTKRIITKIDEYSLMDLALKFRPLLRQQWKSYPKALLWVVVTPKVKIEVK